MKTEQKPSFSLHRNWMSLVRVTILAVFIYVVMEWVFTVTKPSYLDATGFFNKIEVLFLTFSILCVVCIYPLLLLTGTSYLFRSNKIESLLYHLGIFLPAAILASLCLLMFDNFTYTVLKFGIVSTSGIFRGLYAVIFIAVTVYIYRAILRRVRSNDDKLEKGSKSRGFSYGLIAFAIAPTLILIANAGKGTPLSRPLSLTRDGKLPHILLITSDGVNATNMSLYSYERETTPNIDELAKTSLVAENAFSNAGHTSGSITSLLSGKHPLNTRVLHSPDILRGLDAYQHLPGILRSLGYTTAQFGHNYYVDSHSRNMLDAFAYTNGFATQSPVLLKLTTYVSSDLSYFIYDLADRITDRLRHIFYLKTMENPIEVVNTRYDNFEDRENYQMVLDLFETSENPLFIHVHFLMTHGGKFHCVNKTFSGDQPFETQEDDWMVDFYDDCIYELDSYVQEMIDFLQERGEWDNTILILGSDHSQRYVLQHRIPLLFHFPGGEYAGKIASNVQNFDVAPTILDYLGIDPPDWLDGVSLLHGDPGQRPIFAVDAYGKTLYESEKGTHVLDTRLVYPPFYQFANFTVLYCQDWYNLNSIEMEWTSGVVPGSTSVCDEPEAASEKQIRLWLKEYLEENGFDAASIEP